MTRPDHGPALSAARSSGLLERYALNRKRRFLLWRAFRSRHQLTPVADRTGRIRPGDILAFSTVRNEAIRLPFFLDHYRALGIRHFLIVDNNSSDGTAALLRNQPDVSLWQSLYSYKAARFGVDWLNWLQRRHAHGHWALTVDADEILVYPNHTTRDLTALTGWLDRQGRRSFGAFMLDMYTQGRLSDHPYRAGDDPFAHLCWFDAGNYGFVRQPGLENLWGQGGVRARRFFRDDPRRAPTLTKVPLIRWHRRYAYVSSTHSALPRQLNHTYDPDGGELTSGVLLHTKFLHTIVARSAEEQRRRQHFANSDLYDDYYDQLIGDPSLLCPCSTRLRGWRQLEALGLMSRGGWV